MFDFIVIPILYSLRSGCLHVRFSLFSFVVYLVGDLFSFRSCVSVYLSRCFVVRESGAKDLVKVGRAN